MTSWNEWVSPLEILFALMILSISVLRYEKDWAKPMSLTAIWVLLFIVSDGLYTLIVGDYGPREYGRSRTPVPDLTYGVLLWTIAIAAIISSFYLSSRGNNDRTATDPFSRNFELIYKTQFAETVLLFGTFCLSVLALFLITRNAAAQGLTFAQISGQKNVALANGAGPLLTLMLSYQGAVLLVFFRRVKQGTVAIRRFIPHILVACAFDLAVGTRSGVIFSLIIPIMLAQHYLNSRIDLKKLFLPLVVIMLLLVPIYRSLTRDVGFERNKSLSSTQVVANNFAGLPKMLFGGFEISALDGTIDVVRTWGKQKSLLGGETIFQSPVALVPRQLYGDSKIKGGASTTYTTTLYPNSGGELLTSFVGELFMNGEAPAVVLGFLVTGVILAALTRWTFDRNGAPKSDARLLVYSIIFGRYLALLRGDLFGFMAQTFNMIAVTSILLLVMALLSKSRSASIGRDTQSVHGT